MPDTARRTDLLISFDGVDITDDIRHYILSFTYTDNEEDESDSISIQLQDRDAVWITSWLDNIIQASAAAQFKMSAVIKPVGWGKGPLPTGSFELDSVSASGPPLSVTLTGVSLPFSKPIRQTKKSKTWKNQKLSAIAAAIASNAGMSSFFDSVSDPFFSHKEQKKTSDMEFLSELCHESGISLKVTDSQLILFDQLTYETKAPVLTIQRAAVVGLKGGRGLPGGIYGSFDMSSSAAGSQYASCRVSYTDPNSGTCIEGTALAAGEDGKSGQRLEISQKVSSAGEAKTLAEKYLRLHNKRSRTASLTLPGDTSLVAGVPVQLDAFGGWSGKYIIKQAVHTVDSNGYTTKIELRRCLEGY